MASGSERMTAVRLLPQAGYRSMRWRNGAGTTQEIARDPASGEFDWRLSLATLAASGPFSVYAGYQRLVALAGGAGFALTVAAAPPVRLAAPGEHLLFPGEAATGCELLAGACTDLSLMVRRPGAILGVESMALDGERVPLRLAAPLAAVFCLAGSVVCTPGGAAVEPARLEAFDTLLLAGGLDVSAARAPGAASARVLVLRWQAVSETTKICPDA
jgi:environmental stress-induced protein Ves